MQMRAMHIYIYIYIYIGFHLKQESLFYFLKEEEERKKVHNVSKLFKICHKRGSKKAKNTIIDPKCPLLVRRLVVRFCHQ
jgi:hypothetical protein